MLAEDMRRLADEIAGAYEARVRSISEIKAETAEKLAGFMADLKDSSRERAERFRDELEMMGDALRTDLSNFKSGLAQFKDDLDEAEKGRKSEMQAEIAERAQHVVNLRKDTLSLVRDFENARKEMWRRMKSDLHDFTAALAGFRADLAEANSERLKKIRSELREMGERLRSDLKGFMSLLARFKTDLDTAERSRKGEALAEIAERKKDVEAVLEATRDLLKDFGTAREEMWDSLKSQLEAFIAELAQFKADLDTAERSRKGEALAEIADRRKEVEAVLEATRDLLKDFGTAREEMWDSLKSQLEAFIAELAQFKADMDKSEEERKESTVRDLKEKAHELRSALSGFTAELSAGVAGMIGELKRDRGEATQAWNQILSAIQTSRGKTSITPVVKAKTAVVEQTVSEAVEKEEKETPPQDVSAKKEMEPQPEMKADEVIEEGLDEREGLISEILGILEENPGGLRMVEIADSLGVANWRSLIPIMKELLDDGDVRKEDSTYFIV